VSDHILPVLYTLFLWWFSTGLIVWLDGLPRRTFRWSLLGATILAAIGLYGLAVSAQDTSVSGAFTAFTCGLIIWGWNEISFLMAFITGPRREAASPSTTGWLRLRHAVEAIAYHELAIAASAALVVAITWEAPNQIGTWTFLILWAMRLSAKLNVFLGVPNLGSEFLPDHLRYLESFFRKRPMNCLFPVSVTLSTTAAILLAQAAGDPNNGGFETAGFTFLATLVALALLEHWLLVLPLPAASLWNWYLGRRAEGGLAALPLTQAISPNGGDDGLQHFLPRPAQQPPP
jgi:putative photosynthetic complex assembly protein 2